MKLLAIQKDVRALAAPKIAENARRFFKTGKGEYGEGDQFLGVRVPQLRELVKLHRSVLLEDILKILQSAYHEERLLALFMLVDQYKRSKKPAGRTAIYQAYLGHTRFVNNWNLVDSSAYQIVGCYLFDKDRAVLNSLCQSDSLWERRISIIACYYFIKHDQFKDALNISKALLNDQEDLIHKAVGWMLREVGNRNRGVETEFLARHYKVMPRTMLRYAIEKYDDAERQRILSGQW